MKKPTAIVTVSAINESAVTEPTATESRTHKMILDIFVASHCSVCEYTKEVYETIRQRFPAVMIQLISIDQPNVTVPEVVFATPTYLLNGKIWSLGNPSWEQIEQTFA